MILVFNASNGCESYVVNVTKDIDWVDVSEIEDKAIELYEDSDESFEEIVGTVLDELVGEMNWENADCTIITL